MSSKHHLPLRAKHHNGDAARSGVSGSSIRGKISGPIIIEDDEFPIRTPGTSIATSLPGDGPERSAGLPISSNASAVVRREQGSLADPIAPGNASGEEHTHDDTSRAESRNAFGPAFREDPQQSAGADEVRNGDTKIRRKRTLKSMLGRLFGRKQRHSSSSAPVITSDDRAAQRLSEPSGVVHKERTGGQRSVSLPVNDYNRALRSHSAAPDTLLEDDGPIWRQDDKRDSHDTRRNSDRLHGLSRHSAAGFDDWTGLSPRPTSSHARSSRLIDEAWTGDIIGMAITSGAHPKRRSRSLGQLRRIAKQDRVPQRRRSEEIRYWRISHDGPVQSPGRADEIEAEAPAPEVANTSVGEVDPGTQSQQFDFGPIGGVKITQAASLETRVSQLEARMHRVERAVSQILEAPDTLSMHGAKLRSTLTDWTTSQDWLQASPIAASPAAPERTPPSDVLRTGDADLGEHVPHHMHKSPTGILELHVGTRPETRPISTATTATVREHAAIAEVPMQLPPPQDDRPTMDHYKALSSMMRAEQRARQTLELVVASLQRDMQALQATASAQHSGLNRSDNDETHVSAFDRDSSDDGSATHGRDEEFRTPNEDQSSDEEDLGDQASTDEMDQQMARTLSLSQLTMGGSQGAFPP